MKWFTLDLLRQILMIVGGIVVALGYKDQATVTTIIGIIMSVASAIWQIFDHSAVQDQLKSLVEENKGLRGPK